MNIYHVILLNVWNIHGTISGKYIILFEYKMVKIKIKIHILQECWKYFCEILFV